MIFNIYLKLHNELKVIYGQFLSNRNLLVFLKIQKILFITFLKRKYWINKIYKNNKLNENDLKKYKKSETLFVFGSGQSLNEISDKEFEKINKEDTIGFSHTILLKKIFFTFHLHRGGTTRQGAIFFNNDYCKYFVKKICENKFYKNTIFLFTHGYTSSFTNELIGAKLFPKFFKFFLFFTNRTKNRNPTLSFKRGIIHNAGTLCDAVNFGVIMNYKKIVLVGVDLYNASHFFCPPGKTYAWDDQKNDYIFVDISSKGIKASSTHNTVSLGIIDTMKNWRVFLEKKGISLEIYNKKSLLTKELKVFEF